MRTLQSLPQFNQGALHPSPSNVGYQPPREWEQQQIGATYPTVPHWQAATQTLQLFPSHGGSLSGQINLSRSPSLDLSLGVGGNYAISRRSEGPNLTLGLGGQSAQTAADLRRSRSRNGGRQSRYHFSISHKINNKFNSNLINICAFIATGVVESGVGNIKIMIARKYVI